jgi:hypothetical protein
MMQPMYDSGFSLLGVGIIAVGIIGIVLGFAIIRRITRDPEDGSDHWRSHRR